jgi:hypothetical protein
MKQTRRRKKMENLNEAKQSAETQMDSRVVAIRGRVSQKRQPCARPEKWTGLAQPDFHCLCCGMMGVTGVTLGKNQSTLPLSQGFGVWNQAWDTHSQNQQAVMQPLGLELGLHDDLMEEQPRRRVHQVNAQSQAWSDMRVGREQGSESAAKRDWTGNMGRERRLWKKTP